MAASTMDAISYACAKLASNHGIYVDRYDGVRRDAATDEYRIRATLAMPERSMVGQIEGTDIVRGDVPHLAAIVDDTLAAMAAALKTEQLIEIVTGKHALLTTIEDEEQLLRVEAAALRLLKYVEAAQMRMRSK